MSKRFVNETVPRSIRGGLVAAASALLLAACGASTPRQAAVERPTAVTPEPTVAAQVQAPEQGAAEAPRPSAAADPGRRRRGERAPAEEAAPAAVVEALPEAVVAAYDRALAAMRTQDWLTAQVELEQLTGEYPAYPGPYVNLAIVLMHDGHPDEARKALDSALALDPGHAAANNQLGILLREQGKFEEAEQAYRRALATDPNHALAHYNLAVLLDIYLRRPADAVEQYEAYQSSLAEPDENVARWIIDLRRRAGTGGDAARVAQGAEQ